jgi:hypothetical protein
MMVGFLAARVNRIGAKLALDSEPVFFACHLGKVG